MKLSTASSIFLCLLSVAHQALAVSSRKAKKGSGKKDKDLVFYSPIGDNSLISDFVIYADIALEEAIGVGVAVCTATGGDLLPIQCQSSFRFDKYEGDVPTTLAHQGITDFGLGFAIVTGGTGELEGITGHGYATSMQDDGVREFAYTLSH